MAELEIDRLKKKARAGEPLTAQEGLWLVEKVNQLRYALAAQMGAEERPHPLVVKMARDEAQAALRDTSLQVGQQEPPRGNQAWAEWGLNAPADAV